VNVETIPLAKPDISDSEVQAVINVLRTDRLSIGPHTEAFEALLASRAGRKYGIAVNSGTSGLHLCVRALGLGEGPARRSRSVATAMERRRLGEGGDEVITTPFSFIATTNCLLFERVRPIFVDIDPDSYNLDPATIEAAITPRAKAILPVEVFGNMAHFDEYERIARKHGLLLIEDCCEALGGVLNCDGKKRPAGSFGTEAGVFAFYPNKQITTGEGGMIVTDSPEIRDLCVSMRNQGRDTQAWLSHARLGYNYRISEVSAALGEAQANRLDEILEKRRQAAKMYDEALADIEEIHLPPMANREQASWFVYVIRLADKFTQADRDAILEHLRKAGVGCNNYFAPIHTQPFIMKMFGTKAGDFPVTERVAARTIALPFFAGLTESQVEKVKTELTNAIASVS